MTWPEYLSIITEGAVGARIAERAGMPESTISRWLSGKSDPRPRQVVAVARAYNVSPLHALIAAGYLDQADVDLGATVPRKLQLRDFTELELAHEIVRRVEAGQGGVLEDPLDDTHPALTNVSPIGKNSKPRVRENVAAAEPPRDRRLEVRRIDVSKVRDPEAAKKKAALRDPEMNNDENFD